MSDVIVIGAGLIGSAMGTALAQAGLKVDLIDATPTEYRLSKSYDGRTCAIAQGSMHVLKAIGVWQKIDDACPILDIHVCDKGGRFSVHYDHKDAGNQPFGHIVENRLLREALYGVQDAEKNLTLYQPDTVVELNQQPAFVEAVLASGKKLKAQLVLVADGKFSKTRDLLGIKTKVFEYGQTAIVCTLKHSKPHHGLAVERFMPSGPFAMLPMTNDRTNLVWAESDEMAARMLELDEKEVIKEIQKRVGDHLGEIELTGPRYSYPLKLIHAERYTDHRVALIGDSAHAIHPIAGQGANLGYRDVAVMAELLTEHAKLGLDLGGADVLDHYQQWRRYDTVTMTAVTDALNRLFSNDLRPFKIARDLGLGVVDQIMPLKQFLMRDAMGMTGDLPAMMRDEAA